MSTTKATLIIWVGFQNLFILNEFFPDWTRSVVCHIGWSSVICLRPVPTVALSQASGVRIHSFSLSTHIVSAYQVLDIVLDVKNA